MLTLQKSDQPTRLHTIYCKEETAQNGNMTLDNGKLAVLPGIIVRSVVVRIVLEWTIPRSTTTVRMRRHPVGSPHGKTAP